MSDQKERPTVHTQNPMQGIEKAMERITHRVVVFSGKGGVGKTTVAVNLAYAFAERGLRVGLLDADITGPNVPQMTGLSGGLEAEAGMIVPRDARGVKVISIASMIEGGTPIIWRGPLRSKIIDQFLGEADWGELDILIADLPPGTGDEVLTITQHTSPEMAIIVTTPQEVALIDARRATNMAKKMEIKEIGIVENMSGLICPHCGGQIDLFGAGGGEEEARKLDVSFLGKIPIDPQARTEADKGRPILLERPDAAISLAFAAMAEKIREMLQ
ncbi:MAG: Mrp/NBP35 family ATP-binding protein [Candidatus Bipolaricaulota bacterium]|nr:Mrp/NBP35 family ATP-binding protein [Candidatus Bipolaricaulota bacterium]